MIREARFGRRFPFSFLLQSILRQYFYFLRTEFLFRPIEFLFLRKERCDMRRMRRSDNQFYRFIKKGYIAKNTLFHFFVLLYEINRRNRRNRRKPSPVRQ